MKTVYTNTLINLLEKKKSKLSITEFNENYIVVDKTPIYFSKFDDEVHFSLVKEEGSIYVEFKSSEINIDAGILGIGSDVINYKTILPIVSPQETENLKILLIFLITENKSKIEKEEFVKHLVKIHSHPNISNDALKSLFENSLLYMEKKFKEKKNKISFSDKEITIKYSLKDIDKMTEYHIVKDSMKLFEEI